MKKGSMAVIAFTPNGKELTAKIEQEMNGEWEITAVFRPSSFGTWLKEQFHCFDAFVFIGAMGIMVRALSGALESKLTDPAVVVLDEKGQFVISVLSGHLGGANVLTKTLAERLKATAVLTTASDVNGKLAIDVFAQKNGLIISSMEQAKRCAACIVAAEPVSFACSRQIKEKIPSELSASSETSKFHVIVSPYVQEESEELLHLIPKAFILGIGCKKGTSAQRIEQRVLEELDKKKITLQSIRGIASINLKKEEAGLLTFAKKEQIPLHFYSADQLKCLEGNFSASAFVSSVTGVENVCERAAWMLAKAEGSSSLEKSRILPKSGKDGVTVSIMEIDWRVSFE